LTITLTSLSCVVAGAAAMSFVAGLIAGLGWGYVAGRETTRSELTWTRAGEIPEA